VVGVQEDARPIEPAPEVGVLTPASGARTLVVGDAWGGLAPRFDWRPSQRHLLELASGVADRRWHLCAPPGAGKTLIGLELARRVARPTLVLAPTTAIRDQWREAVAKFGADPRTFTADDVSAPVPLRAVTYQLLGNPGDAAAELEAAARRLWLAEVARESGPEGAEHRVAATESRDPARARRELRRHVRVLRRSLATGTTSACPAGRCSASGRPP
jgi:type III restriction/modification enzyme restriction subunit